MSKRSPAAWGRIPACVLCWLAATTGAAAAEHQVIIDRMAFTPQQIEAQPGDVVIWVNNDMFVHNVTATGTDMRSGDLQPGQTWKYTVPNRPSIAYTCTLHRGMSGQIKVVTKPTVDAKQGRAR